VARLKSDREREREDWQRILAEEERRADLDAFNSGPTKRIEPRRQ